MRLSTTARGWLLCAPALAAMALVAGYPIASAVWLSLQRFDLRLAERPAFIGLQNYASVLTAPVWWHALGSTLLITVVSVMCELVLGFAIASVMHRVVFGRRLVRSAVLVPYALITVVAALCWKFAFDPTVGFVQSMFPLSHPWLNQSWSAFAVIIASEVWKTTPFVALLLLAGLALIPQDVLAAARVDGAGAWQRLTRVTLPLMKPTIFVALLFRALDAFRIFDAVFMLTRGAYGTETVSLVGYNTLIVRLDLGLGSAVSVLIFACVILIALLLAAIFGKAALPARVG